MKSVCLIFFFASSGTLFFQTSVLSRLYDIKFWAKAHSLQYENDQDKRSKHFFSTRTLEI